MQLKVLETKIIKQNRADLCLQFNTMRFSTPATERIQLFYSCSIPLPKRDRSFSVSPTFPVTEVQVEPTRSATANAMF